MKILNHMVKIVILLGVVMIVNPTLCNASEDIPIDGYFDEWENIPKTPWYYNSLQEDQWHYAAAVVTGEYIYCYVETADFYSGLLPEVYFRISINGKSVVLRLYYSDMDGNIDYSKWGDLNHLPAGVNTGISVFAGYYPVYNVGDAAIEVSDMLSGDRLEMRIKISDLESILNLPEGSTVNGGRIQFYSPMLGRQKVEIVGTSTGSLLGIGISLVFICGAAWLRNRRNRGEI